MFISYPVFTFHNAACVNLYLNIFTADVFGSPLVISGQNADMIQFHYFNKKSCTHSVLISLNQIVMINFKGSSWWAIAYYLRKYPNGGRILSTLMNLKSSDLVCDYELQENISILIFHITIFLFSVSLGQGITFEAWM